MKGAVAKTTAAAKITRRRPMMSDRIPAGRLTTIPTTVEAAAIKPTVETGTPIERMNKGSAGFFAIVELRIASPPIRHKSTKGDGFIFIYGPSHSVAEILAQGYTRINRHNVSNPNRMYCYGKSD
jgi:hypothetical protein